MMRHHGMSLLRWFDYVTGKLLVAEVEQFLGIDVENVALEIRLVSVRGWHRFRYLPT
jgi:hypothetical protein